MRSSTSVLLFAVSVALTTSAAAVAANHDPDYSAANASPCLLVSVDGFCGPRLEPKVVGEFRPKGLPRFDLTPIAFNLRGKILNSDGTAPPALRELTIGLDRQVAVDASGLPACGRSSIAASGVAAARRMCQESMVGAGVADIALASHARKQVRLRLSFFNAEVGDGTTKLLVHSSLPMPEPTPIVAPVMLEKAQGRYGLEAVLKMPPILDGGVLLNFNFRIKRFFGYEGSRQHFALARCFDGRLQLRLELEFVDDTSIAGVLLQPCVVRS